MQKVTAFLERYVEWVAIALGGAFMLFMVFVYLIGTPISAKLGTTTVTLANVESSVYDDAGRKLEQAMSETAVPTATIEPFASNFKGYMAMKDAPLPQLAQGQWIGGGTPEKPLAKGPEKEDGKATEPKVNNLPGPLPAPKFYAYSTGRSNVQTEPGANVAGDFGFGAMGGIAAPIGAGYDDERPVRPGTSAGGTSARTPVARKPAAGTGVVAAGAAAPAAAKPGGTDKIWVTEAFTIPIDAIVDAFDNAKVPPGPQQQTMFLRVEVLRQEQMPDGSWGNETQIPPLPYHQVPAYPKQGNKIEEGTYQEWAQANQQTILVPSFYIKLAGDTWFAPGQPNPNKSAGAQVRPVVNPIAPPQPRTRGRTGGMGPTGPGGPMGGSGSGRRTGGGGRSYAPDDPQRPTTPFMQGAPPEAIRAAQEAAMRGQQQAMAAAAAARAAAQGTPQGAGPTGMPGFGPGGVVGQPTVSVPDGYKVPTGNFVPAEFDADVFGWFHDDTVEPGKTYRYKVAYKLRNPLYGNPKFGQLASVFAITSPMSEWSDAITVDPVTKFYVAAGVPNGASSVRFDVYHWQDGKWQTKQFAAAPGDEIGTNDGAINYDTGWALADLDGSAMSHEPVIIANAQGKLDSRSFPTDQGAQAEFKKEINLETAPKTPAGGAPGFPSGPGGPGPGFTPPGLPPGFVPGPPPGVGGPPRGR